MNELNFAKGVRKVKKKCILIICEFNVEKQTGYFGPKITVVVATQ